MSDTHHCTFWCMSSYNYHKQVMHVRLPPSVPQVRHLCHFWYVVCLFCC